MEKQGNKWNMIMLECEHGNDWVQKTGVHIDIAFIINMNLDIWINIIM